MKSNQQRTLVLGSQTARDYAIIRSLGRSGISVVATVEQNQSSPFLASRFLDSTITLPDKRKSDIWARKLAEHLKTNKYDLVIPTDDYTTHAIHNNRWILESSNFAQPSFTAWESIYNKRRTFSLAQELNVPVPRSINVDSKSQLHAVDFAEWQFPLVFKPISSKLQIGFEMIWLKHGHAYDIDDLYKKAGALLQFCGIFVQEFCPGVGLGQGFLLSDGNPVYVFQWQRIHEPLLGGASSYRVSTPTFLPILEASEKILQRLKFTGVAMVEYRYDSKSKRFWLMEINGRFWGSLPLAVAAKADFPVMLYDLMVHGKRPKKSKNYLYPIYCRNIKSDIDWLIENIRADKSNPFLHRHSVRRVLGEIRHLIMFRERYDELHFDDPVPGIKVLGQIISTYTAKIARKLLATVVIRICLSSAWIRGDSFRLKTIGRLAKRKKLLFLCFGNICRSPFADLLWQEKYNGKNDAWQCSSAGHAKTAGRSPPQDAILVSRRFGVNLTQYKSRNVTYDILSESSIVICMESQNLHFVLSEWPSVFYKCFLIRKFSPHSIDIPDPYGKSKTVFLESYRLIESALGIIADTILKKFPD